VVGGAGMVFGMGQANRQRRRMKEKERKRSRAAQPRPPSPQTPFDAVREAAQRVAGPSASEQQRSEEVLAAIMGKAFHALIDKNARGFEAAVTRLVERPDVGGWRAFVEQALAAQLQDAVTEAWKHGWQPADLARLAGRRFGGEHVLLVGDAIAAELKAYAPVTIDPRWSAQLAELEAQVWWPPSQTFLRAWCELPKNSWAAVMPLALELLVQLRTLPVLQLLGPLPGAFRAPTSAREREGKAVDERVLSRVRALLAKAEATTSEAEAEAFTAGAQERMARHSIDAAMLAATEPDNSQKPTGRRIGIDNPYEGSKASLLHAVSQANRCRSVWSKELGFSTVIGFESDLDAVETLFTSLLIQAVRAMTSAGSRTDRYGRSRTRAFRQSFLAAYAGRIGERLMEVTEAQTKAATAESGGKNLLPVLASRDHDVDEAMSTLFPRLTHTKAMSVTDAEGWHSGRGAADLATLHSGEAISR
jgi:Protein of unknown function (DUF2786)